DQVIAATRPQTDQATCNYFRQFVRKDVEDLIRKIDRELSSNSDAEQKQELNEMRSWLKEQMGKMGGNDKLEQLIGEVLTDTEQANSLAKELGIGAAAPEAPEVPLAKSPEGAAPLAPEGGKGAVPTPQAVPSRGDADDLCKTFMPGVENSQVTQGIQ